VGADVLRQAKDLATVGARRAKLHGQTEVVAGFAAGIRIGWQRHRDQKIEFSRMIDTARGGDDGPAMRASALRITLGYPKWLLRLR